MNSVLDIIFKQVKQRMDSPALFYLEDQSYIPITFREMALCAQRLSRYISDQCGPGQLVVIWSNNCWQWAITDLAIQLAGAVSVPIYPTIGFDQLDYILGDATPALVFVDFLSDDRWDVLEKVSGLKKIIVYGDIENRPGNNMVIDFDDALSSIPELMELDASQWMMHRLNEIMTILYTSGTTGTPKAVPLTHQNIVQNFLGILDIIPISYSDSSLSFLPLSHIFERTVGFYCVLGVGASIYYAASIDTVARDLLIAKPTFIISVPRLYEKIYQKVMLVTGVKQLVLKMALIIGRLMSERSIIWRLAYRIVFSKIHQKTGGNVRFLVTGGAPISPHIEVFFNAIGLPVVQGYGLTETSPIITANLDRKVGSVGKVLSNLELRILDDGEVCVKGLSVFSGYANASNDDVFTVDGYFKTGDIGYLDDDGYLVITGRKKEIIVLSNGKNVSPNQVEDQLLQSEFVNQIVVVGNNHNYLVALVVPDFDQVCQALDVSLSPAELIVRDDVYQLVFGDLKRFSSRMASFETIKKIKLLSSEFSISGMELTPTLKLRRDEINKKYQDLIESLYDD